jgi:YaiO family outer membrane protein
VPAVTWRVDSSVALSRLTQDLPDWTEARLSLVRREGPWSAGGLVEYARHFDVEDVYGEVQASYQAGPVVWLMAVGGAPQADFRPDLSVRIGAERYEEHWVAGGAFTHSEYPVGPVDKFDLRFAHDVGAGVRVRVSGVALHDEQEEARFGYGIGADWAAAPGVVLDVAWSDAPETSDGVTVDVRAASLGAAFEISPGLRLRAGLLQEMRDAYDRTEISVGFARTY